MVFQIFELGNTFEIQILIQKVNKHDFFAKKSLFLAFFGQNFLKYCPNQKFEKKKKKTCS